LFAGRFASIDSLAVRRLSRTRITKGEGDAMGRIIEYTLISADGVFENPASWGAFSFRDDAYLRDGLGLLQSCGAMVMGRSMYESSSAIWPTRTDPWAKRLNVMPKFVFSSQLATAEWSNTTIIRGDVVVGVTDLKSQVDGDILIWGHGLLAETLWGRRLIDVLDLSIHPVLVGHGKPFFREGLAGSMKLVATKTFSSIVKLTYEPQP
jgi:dihydrofolate reductase